MHAKTGVVIAFVLLSAQAASSDDARPAEGLVQDRVAWLKKHVVPVRSVDPAEEDFSDREPIPKALGDSRIVFLGEEWHGSEGHVSGWRRPSAL